VSAPDLDRWLAEPVVRVHHRRTARASPDALWAAAGTVTLRDTRVLGQLVRWRIPGLAGDLSYFDLFAGPPFVALHSDQRAFVSGLCGRIWTLRRDYPQLPGPQAFTDFDEPGTVRVLYANWVEELPGGRAAILSETRVQPIDRGGRLGLMAVTPLIRAFEKLVGSEALAAVVAAAQSGG
jgi:hypothetical protein